MKKVLAMVLTVAMLLTCLIAMPVSADNALAELVNLEIANPSFELDAPGKTITGWTKGYEEAEGAVTWDVKSGTGVTAGSQMIGIGAGNGGNKWLSQVIDIPENISANISEYKWEFKNYNTYCTTLKVKVYGAEGTTPVEGSYDDFNKRAAAVHESVIDITTTMTALLNPTKVEISITGHNNGGTYDDIRLIGTLIPDEVKYGDEIKLPIVNPGFEASSVDDSSVIGAANPIYGWEGTSTSAGWVVASDGRGKFIRNGATTKIKQTIEFHDSLSALLGAYNWTFKAGLVYCVYLDVTLYNADKSQSVTTSFDTFDKRNGGYHEAVLDLTEALGKMKNAKFVEIALWGHGNNNGAYYDVAITGTVKPLSESNIANSNFETLGEDGVPTGWSFANVGEATDLVISSAGDASEGVNFVKLPAGGRIETEYAGIRPGKAYILEVNYKQLGEDAFITVEDIANGYNKIKETAVGGATGTTEADLIWNKYMFAFIAPETTNGGILIRLRNGNDENPAYYDRVVLKEAANFDKDELLINGDFNINYGAGATTLVGSFQPHAGAPDMIVTQGDGVLHTGANVIAIARVDVDEYDYANGKNYGYKFVVDFDYGGGGIPGLWVRARFADGTELAQDVAFVRRNSTDPVPDNLDPKTQMDVILWVKQTITYDLTWITQSTTSPVVGIDIQLKGGGVEAKWDNASLRAVRGDIDLVDANGNEITGFITEEGVTIKPAISNFSTEDAGATLWLCMYEVDGDGVTRLVNAVCGPVDSELKFEGVSTVAGATVVKAIVLGSDMNYLLSETVK